ncbi:SubName: Full=Uncharacterized protein {ECO:0000313/EMBL:CCA66593.1} [Serendipita indica DSM 11827]|nr:SubName: Full=Uncharacterized protein {ECO:0000313/EMBL:CCA66593.1} [Serendipita indica DSM 11827]
MVNDTRKPQKHVVFFRKRLQDQNQTQVDPGSQVLCNRAAFKYCREALGVSASGEYLISCKNYNQPVPDLPLAQPLQLLEARGTVGYTGKGEGIDKEMPSYMHLPEEVLDNIFAALRDVQDETCSLRGGSATAPSWTKLRAICNLMRVCKAWRLPAARATLRIIAMDIHRDSISSLVSMLVSLKGHAANRLSYNVTMLERVVRRLHETSSLEIMGTEVTMTTTKSGRKHMSFSFGGDFRTS